MRKYLLLLVIVFTAQYAFAQDFSNKGKDFYLCFPNHVPSGNALAKLSIWITSDQASSGTITMANGAYSGTFNIAANGLAEIQIPQASFSSVHIFNTESTTETSTQILKKSIRIKVDAGKPDVVAYVQQYNAARSAASLLLPVNVLGRKYYVASFTEKSTSQSATPPGGTSVNFIGKSQFQIIATQDNTVVSITTRKNGVLGTPFTVTLPLAGDMIQYQSADAASTSQDLTGTYIESVPSGTGGCLPIAVFSGSSSLAIGTQTGACNAGSYDPLFQQLYPTTTWGKNFGFIPFNPNLHYPRGVPYRVMAASDNTNVYFNGTLVATLNAGQIYPSAFTSTPVTLTAPTFITADQPICVMEYMESSGCGGSVPVSNQGDPDMVILNPIEQNIKDITLFSTKQEVINSQWINVVIPTAGIASFQISRNGNNFAPPLSAWQPFAALPGYSYIQDSLNRPTVGAGSLPGTVSDSYRLVSDSGFNAIAYGLGDNESYAYSAGTNVKDLYQQISVHTQYGIETTPSVCTGSPFQFKISLPYKPLQLTWDLSSLPGLPAAQQHPVQNPDPTCIQYTLPADNLTYICPDSIRTVNGVPIYWFSLPTYYMVPTIGTYQIHLTALTSNADGCGANQYIDFPLQVSDPPIADFTYNIPGCVADTVRFSDASVTVKPEYHWFWDFGDPGSGANNTSALKNPIHIFSTPGPHAIKFSSITTPGCLSDTVRKTITVPAQPGATISGTTAVCQNGPAQTITFTPTPANTIPAYPFGTPPYTYTYHIVNGATVGPDITVTGSGTWPYTATATALTNIVGTFTYVLTNIQNSPASFCTTPITGQTATITVNPLPTATISGAATVCQNSAPPPTIAFTGANGTPPYTFDYTINGIAQTPVSSPGTTSVRTLTQPTTTPGNYIYNITKITDASSTACANPVTGQTVTVTVNQLPTATISGTVEYCLNAAPTQITFTGSGGTRPYKFTYTLNGITQPVLATSGTSSTATVTAPVSPAGTYNFTLVSVQESSSTNCINTASGTATIIVDPQPTASFTYSTPDCQSRDITYTPTFGVSSGSVVSWIWDYGDGTGSHTRANGNPFIINYATPGTKIVTFKTVSDKGCISAVYTQNVVVSAKPKAGFINPEICLLDPFAQFNDTSHVATGQPGSIVAWDWNFGDGFSTPANNVSTFQNPQHLYTHVGPYAVQQIVTSSFGCKDTVTQNIYISDGNPQSDFIVNNAAGLCSNDSVGITNKSIIASGNITKLEIYWDYLNQPAVFDLKDDPFFNAIYKHKYPTLTTAQNYTIHVRAYSGGVCFSSKDIIITVHAAPVTQLNAIPDICLNNGTVQFTQGSETAGVPGTGVYSGTGVSSTGLFNPLTSGAGTFPITYTFTSNFGCIDKKTVNVKVLRAPIAVFAPAPVTCQNNAITFTQNSTSLDGTLVTWIWHWGDGSADETYSTGNPRTHTYTSPGSFTATLTVITNYGCKSTPKSVTFTVNPQPHPKFGFTAVACLPQAKIDFTNSTFPGSTTDWTYQWNFDDINANTSNPNTSTAITPSHIYTSVGPFNVHLVATSPTTQCTNDTTIVVNTIHPAPVASFSMNKTSICTDQTLKLTDHSSPADGVMTVWSWDYGDNTGITHGQVQQPHTYTDAGSYTITLNVTNSFGCVDDTSRPFVVYPYPTVSAGPDQTVLQDGISHLQGTAAGNQMTYLWTPSTYITGSVTTLNPSIQPHEDITYKLTVTAEGGCKSSDSVFVEVLKAPLIPNTFTPNNDGVHDLWEIKYLFQYPDNFVQVFTRTGQLVFQSHGYSKPWNGTKEGKPLPFDTYYYIIEPGSGRAPITGYVTIIK